MELACGVGLAVAAAAPLPHLRSVWAGSGRVPRKRVALERSSQQCFTF